MILFDFSSRVEETSS